MNEKLMESVMNEVISRLRSENKSNSSMKSSNDKNVKQTETQNEVCEFDKSEYSEFSAEGVTEFIGTGPGDTIGLVIPSVDSNLLKETGFEGDYKSIGVVGGRTGAGPQLIAADEAIKSTNAKVIAVELSRDTKGGAGHGTLVVFGADDVSDVRNAVEITLDDLNRTYTCVYSNNAGHVETQYTARASDVLHKAFNAKIGEAFGIIVGAPAPIGFIMADRAMKSANVDIVKYGSPSTVPYPNEVTIFISGDSEAVKQSVSAARDVGIVLLEKLGQESVESTGEAYF